MNMSRRYAIQSGVCFLGLSAGCSAFGESSAEIEHHFSFGWDKELVRDQPTNLTGTSGWVDYTTNPQDAKEMIRWERMMNNLGEDTPGTNEFYDFEAGQKCLLAIVTHNNEDHTLESVSQENSEMFDTGTIELSFVDHTSFEEVEYLYDVSLWDLNGQVVPDGLELELSGPGT